VKRFMATRQIVSIAIMMIGACNVFAAPPGLAQFDTGGVKMIAPMKGLGCNPADKIPCNKNAPPDVTGAVNQMRSRSASNYEGKLKPGSMPKEEVFKGAAGKANRFVESKPYQAHVEDYKEQLKSGVFKDGGFATGTYGKNTLSSYPDVKRREKSKQQGAKPLASKIKKTDRADFDDDERIYVFISSSIPIPTLRAYAEDMGILNTPNVRMIMRGFVGDGGMKNATATKEFWGEILNKDHLTCRPGAICDSFPAIIDLDPNMFRRYKPEVVPAIVYVKGVRPLIPDVSEGHDESVGKLDERKVMMIYGDISLSYALELFAEKTDDDRLRNIADKIRPH